MVARLNATVTASWEEDPLRSAGDGGLVAGGQGGFEGGRDGASLSGGDGSDFGGGGGGGLFGGGGGGATSGIAGGGGGGSSFAQARPRMDPQHVRLHGARYDPLLLCGRGRRPGGALPPTAGTLFVGGSMPLPRGDLSPRRLATVLSSEAAAAAAAAPGAAAAGHNVFNTRPGLRAGAPSREATAVAQTPRLTTGLAAGWRRLASAGAAERPVAGGAYPPIDSSRPASEVIPSKQLVLLAPGAGARPASVPWQDALSRVARGAGNSRGDGGSLWSRAGVPEAPAGEPWASVLDGGGADPRADPDVAPFAYLAVEVPEACGMDPLDRLGRPVGEGGLGAPERAATEDAARPAGMPDEGVHDLASPLPHPGAPGCVVVRFPGHYRAPLNRPAKQRAPQPDDGFGEADQARSRTWQGAEAMEVPFPGVAPRSQRSRRLADREDVMFMGTGAALAGGESAVAGGLPPLLAPYSRAGLLAPLGELGLSGGADGDSPRDGPTAVPAPFQGVLALPAPVEAAGVASGIGSAQFLAAGGSVGAWRSALSRGRSGAGPRRRAHDASQGADSSTIHQRFAVAGATNESHVGAFPRHGGDLAGFSGGRPSSAQRARLAAALELAAETGALGVAAAGGQIRRARPADRGNARPSAGPVVVNGYNNVAAEAVAAAQHAVEAIPEWDTETRSQAATAAAGIPRVALERAAMRAEASVSALRSLPDPSVAPTLRASEGSGSAVHGSLAQSTDPAGSPPPGWRPRKTSQARRSNKSVPGYYGKDGLPRAAAWRPPDPSLPLKALRGLALDADAVAEAAERSRAGSTASALHSRLGGRIP